MYIRRSQNVVSTSLSAYLVSVTADLGPHSASLPTDRSLSIVEIDTFAPSDFDLPIALQKNKQSSTIHSICNLVSYDRLPRYLVSLPCLCPLFLYLSFIRKH